MNAPIRPSRLTRSASPEVYAARVEGDNVVVLASVPALGRARLLTEGGEVSLSPEGARGLMEALALLTRGGDAPVSPECADELITALSRFLEDAEAA